MIFLSGVAFDVTNDLGFMILPAWEDMTMAFMHDSSLGNYEVN
jgi:hypothetical protein